MSHDYRKQQITLPGLSFKGRTNAFVKILSKLHTSDRVESKDDKRKPATVCKIIDLQTGELCRLICPALMVSALNDEGIEYVGKCYEIVVSADKVPGKEYKDVAVYEIDCDGDYTKAINGTEKAEAPIQS